MVPNFLGQPVYYTVFILIHYLATTKQTVLSPLLFTFLKILLQSIKSDCQATFLPCDAMRCTVLVIVILSVCLSVCLSVTLVDCVHMVRPTIMISSPYGSPIILVSGDIPNSEGGHPAPGR